MSKKNEQQSGKEEPVLTEWQKRNLEFLQKKKEQEAEKEKLKEKLRVERKAHLNRADAKSSKVEETVSQPKKEKKQKAKIEKKRKKKVKKSARQKARRRALPIFVVAGLVLLVSVFLVTPISKSKTVTVTGTENDSAKNVLSASKISDSNYIFSLIFNRSSFEKNVVTNDKWIKSAQLTYQFPNDFTLKVKEYDIVGYTQTDSGYQPILENGERMEVASSSDLPETFLTINLTDETQIQQLVTSLSKLDKSLVKEIQIVSLAGSTTTADLLTLDMQDGNTVRVPLSEIEEKLPYYDKIKGNLTETSIVDMEVGIYTTTATIESEAASEQASKESSASETSTSSDATATETETQTESSDDVTTGTEVSENTETDQVSTDETAVSE